MSFFTPKVVPSTTQKELNTRMQSFDWINRIGTPWFHIMSLADSSEISCYKDSTMMFGYGSDSIVNGPYRNIAPRPGLVDIDSNDITASTRITQTDGNRGEQGIKPVCMDISVKAQGNLGTTKKVVFNIKVFNEKDLNNIAKCYLIPGMSVRVQYGWHVDASGTKSPGPITDACLDVEFLQKIKDIQKTYANFDGYQGRIVTFDVKMLDNFAYDVTVEMVAAAGLMSAIKLHNYDGGCVCKQEVPKKEGSDEKKEVTKRTSNIQALLLSIINGETVADSAKNVYKGYLHEYRGYDMDDDGVEDTSGFLGMTDGIGLQYGSYISMATLERMITDAVQTNNKKTNLFKFDSSKTYIKCSYLSSNLNGPTITFCPDPRIAIIPGFKFNGQTWPTFRPAAGSSKSYSSTEAPTAYIGSAPDLKIHLDSVLFNVKYLRKVANGLEGENDTVVNFFNQILTDFNNACGNLWEFAIVDNTETLVEEDNNVKNNAVLTVVDLTLSETNNVQPYVFKTTNNGNVSIIPSIGMSMKLTEAMKTQALYSGNLSTPSTTQPCNNLFNPFRLNNATNRGQSADEIVNSITSEVLKLGLEKYKNLTQVKDSEWEALARQANPNISQDNTKAIITNLKDAARNHDLKCGEDKCSTENANTDTWAKRCEDLIGDGTDQGVTNTTTDAVRGDLVALNAKKTAQKDPCSGGIIPVEFSINLRGVGGFGFGQLIDCDRFPEHYRKFMRYQIKSVEHIITNDGGWITNITTVGRYKS